MTTFFVRQFRLLRADAGTVQIVTATRSNEHSLATPFIARNYIIQPLEVANLLSLSPVLYAETWDNHSQGVGPGFSGFYRSPGRK